MPKEPSAGRGRAITYLPPVFLAEKTVHGNLLHLLEELKGDALQHAFYRTVDKRVFSALGYGQVSTRDLTRQSCRVLRPLPEGTISNPELKQHYQELLIIDQQKAEEISSALKIREHVQRQGAALLEHIRIEDQQAKARQLLEEIEARKAQVPPIVPLTSTPVSNSEHQAVQQELIKLRAEVQSLRQQQVPIQMVTVPQSNPVSPICQPATSAAQSPPVLSLDDRISLVNLQPIVNLNRTSPYDKSKQAPKNLAGVRGKSRSKEAKKISLFYGRTTSRLRPIGSSSSRSSCRSSRKSTTQRSNKSRNH